MKSFIAPHFTLEICYVFQLCCFHWLNLDIRHMNGVQSFLWMCHATQIIIDSTSLQCHSSTDFSSMWMGEHERMNIESIQETQSQLRERENATRERERGGRREQRTQWKTEIKIQLSKLIYAKTSFYDNGVFFGCKMILVMIKCALVFLCHSTTATISYLIKYITMRLGSIHFQRDLYLLVCVCLVYSCSIHHLYVCLYDCAS